MKKKILILTSSGGGGHSAANSALHHYLENDYDVHSFYLFKELLLKLDVFNYLTARKYSGEDLYNLFISKKYFRVLRFIYSFGAWYIQLRKNKIRSLLRNYLITIKPNLIISVIPIVNNIVLDVAQELNIPFLLVPTDLDTRMYLINIKNPSYKKFYIGLPFGDEDIMAIVKKIGLSRDQLFVIGSPLQKYFFTKKDSVALKKEYGIDENKPIIMLLMGAQGSCEIEKYTTQLLTIDIPIHLIVCIGKNEKSKIKILGMIFSSHISLSIIEFTNNIADYMTIADMLISKSGTLSVSEALYMNLPLFLDATSTLLPWEEFNHYFIAKHNCGISIKNYAEVAPLITAMINDNAQLMRYKNSSEILEKKNFPEELQALIARILK